VARLFRTTYAPTSTADLPFANPYVGLDELYRSGDANSTTVGSILTKPRVVAQLFPDEPAKHAPIGEHERFGGYGMLTPREQHFQVDRRTRSLFQFRALDFGMEDCALVVRVPTSTRTRVESPEPYLLDAPSALSVCRVDAPQRPLDIRALSYASSPRCVETVGESSEDGLEIVVARFGCPWGSIHTFEVGCKEGEGACRVDVWSSQNQTWGMYMYQYQTI
ncbi:hypothetical protein BV25DRAFT_1813035, partial [Artomyces pyxidatus]